ncbi:MAG: hypothetical protein VB124_03625 [Burkholderia sp.]
MYIGLASSSRSIYATTPFGIRTILRGTRFPVYRAHPVRGGMI